MNELYTSQQDKQTKDFLTVARKIATAVYAVSRLLDSHDDIAESLKKMSQRMMMSLVIMDTWRREKKRTSLEYALEHLETLMSVLELAYRANLVSTMNVSMIRTSMISLHNDIYRYLARLRANMETPIESNDIEKVFLIPDWYSEKGEKEIKEAKETKEIEQKEAVVEKVKKRAKTIKIKQEERQEVLKTYNEMRKREKEDSERRKSISALIQAEGKILGSDVTRAFPEMVRRTLYRELQDMVSEGIIDKIGQNRWTMYEWVGDAKSDEKTERKQAQNS